MAGEVPPQSILRGLYGTFVQAASQGQTTAEVWQSLRDAASSWAQSYLGITTGQSPTPDQVAAEAKTLLSHIDVAQVSTMRGIAGQQVEAMRQLMAADPEAQITGRQVFQAPWSQASKSPYLSPNYRIRVQWDLLHQGFAPVELSEWATYELTGPLTSVADALRQARSAFSAASYNVRTRITGVAAYSIETV